MTSRRTLLKGLPAFLSAPNAAAAPAASYDVIVVGSGAAGLSAALEARKAGARVLVVEKMGSIGGNSVISKGQVAVPCTPMQEKEHLIDSPELFAADMLKLGYVNNPEKVNFLAQNALETFFWTQKELGVRWWEDRVEYDIGHSVRRCALVGTNSGTGLIYPLYDRACTLGVEMRLHCPVVRLLTDAHGAVTGVRVRTGKNEEDIASRSTVVCAGGFGADIALRQMQNWRLSEHVGTTTQPGSTSEMLRECARIGAWTIHLQYIHCIPEASPDEKGWGSVWQFTRHCAAAQGVWVVRETGRRFVAETEVNDVRTNAILDEVNAGRQCLAIADARAVRHPRSVIFSKDNVEELVRRGLVRRYDTLDLLASDMGIPLQSLQKTIEEYNSDLAKKLSHDRMGREIHHANEPMSEAPWYVSRFLPKVHLCGGGVSTDLNARVLSVVDDLPIPGLFAAGEITGGLHGIARLNSCGLLDALVFGRVAGKEAARGA